MESWSIASCIHCIIVRYTREREERGRVGEGGEREGKVDLLHHSPLHHVPLILLESSQSIYLNITTPMQLIRQQHLWLYSIIPSQTHNFTSFMSHTTFIRPKFTFSSHFFFHTHLSQIIHIYRHNSVEAKSQTEKIDDLKNLRKMHKRKSADIDGKLSLA